MKFTHERTVKGMEHETYLEWISADLDGELTPAQHAQLEEHLNTCPSCAQLHRELSQLSGDLHRLTPDVPPQLHQQILDGLPRQTPPVLRFPRAGKACGALAACLALVVALGYSSFQQGQENTPPAAARSGPDIAPAVFSVQPQELSVPGGDTVLLLSAPLSQEGQGLLGDLPTTTLEDGSVCCVVNPDTAAALATWLDSSGVCYTQASAANPDGSGDVAVVWPAE